MPKPDLPAAAHHPAILSEPPRFAIINTTDAPQRRMVCEWVPRVGYCYMTREEEPYMRSYDGMRPDRPKSMEAFGFSVEMRGDKAAFIRTGESTATYEDGKSRPWQDRFWIDRFELPLVHPPFTRRRK